MEEAMLRRGTRVLVTGGAGFIGSHLVRALLAAGHAVRVLDDLSTGSAERLKDLPAELLQGDVRNFAAVRRALDGAQLVFHLAARRVSEAPDDPHPLWRAQEVNLGGAIHVLEAARQGQGSPRVVLASSGEVYGRAAAYLLHEEIPPMPTTPEGVQLLAAEQYARLYWESFGVPTVALRLFTTFGPGESIDGPSLVPRLCLAALTGAEPIIEGDPRHSRDLVYVDNVVSALLCAAEAPSVEGQVFNIASGEATAAATVWSTLCDLAGRRRQIVEPEYRPARSWEQTNVRVSIARANRGLQYSPAVRLREGLKRTLEVCQAQAMAGFVASLHSHAWGGQTVEPRPAPPLRSAGPPRPGHAITPGSGPMAVGWNKDAQRPPPLPPPGKKEAARREPASSNGVRGRETDGGTGGGGGIGPPRRTGSGTLGPPPVPPEPTTRRMRAISASASPPLPPPVEQEEVLEEAELEPIVWLEPEGDGVGGQR
jgi:UDP-glucose 4-epimerase